MSVNIANIMTLIRILAVPFFVSAIVYYQSDHDYLRYVALGIFFVAIFTDIVDGYIARKYHQDTKIGAILDPLADKFLLMSAFICLYVAREISMPVGIPLWILLIVISRDAILLIGGAAVYLTRGSIDVVPSRLGRMTTFFQVIAIIGVLLHLSFFPALWYAVGILSILSGADYLYRGVKVFNDSSR